jgi:hypothetical protein
LSSFSEDLHVFLIGLLLSHMLFLASTHKKHENWKDK